MVPRFHLPLLLAALLAAGCAKPRPDQKLIKEVRLAGVRSLKKDALLDGLETQRTGWWPFADKHYYEPSVLDRDIRRVERYYAGHGFFDARVTRREVSELPGGREVKVKLTVDEGKPALLGAVKLTGLDGLDPGLRAKVTEKLGLTAGQRFSHETYGAAKGALRQRLEQAGYAYAEVAGKVLVNRRAREVRIELQATPGPRVRFGETRVEGNGAIPGDKLLRLVTWKEGALYDPGEVNRTRARLFNQQLFASVSINLPKTPTSEADMQIQVTPTKLRELRLGVGFGFEKKRHEVRLSGRWILRNFLGGMRTLELRLRPAWVALPTIWSAERQGPAVDAEIKLSQPDIFSTRVTAFAAVGYELGLHEGYRFHGPKLQLGADRSFLADYLRAGVSYNFQFLDFFDLVELAEGQNPTGETGTLLLLGAPDPYALAWFEEFLQLDLRDEVVEPRAGLFAEVRLEEGVPPLGSEFSYFKVVPDVRAYIPVFTRRLVLALRAQLGYLEPHGGDDSPVTRRLTLGGPTSHRGFTYGRLSPQIATASGSTIPLGGNASLLGSADLRWRIVKLFGLWLSLVGFFDVGDVTKTFGDLDLAQLHRTAGGSLMFQTPIGSVRIGLGVRLNRLAEAEADGRINPDPGERFAFHLTIGEAF